MLYDSNGFKLYIYVLFFETCPYATHIYILLAYAKIRWISIFWAVSEVSETGESVFTGHVWPMDQTYLTSRTYLGLGFRPIYKGSGYPFKP
jgi:hypothetical protein